MKDKKIKLHLGCGNDYKAGYLNCDISDDVKVDKIIDITQTLPFEDNSVSEIIINHVLEHTDKPVEVIKEFYRVCDNGARVKIRVPYFSCENAYSNITHYHQFTYTSFDLFDVNHSQHWQGAGNFKIVYKKLHWRKIFLPLELLLNLSPKLVRFYQEFFCWIIPARELELEMEVVK